MAKRRYTRRSGQRRSKRRRQQDAKTVATFLGIGLIVYIIYVVVDFLSRNPWILYTIGILAVLTLTLMSMLRTRKVRQYKRSHYYLETKLPYKMLKKPGVAFEAKAYNALKEAFPEAKFIVNALIPRMHAMNEYFEIDIMMLWRGDIYVIELKDWSGFIYGNVDSPRWTRGETKDNKRKTMQVYSPIEQNNNHILDLSKHHPYDYKGIVIFSERANFNSTIEEIHTLDSFIGELKSAPREFEDKDGSVIFGKLHKLLRQEKLSEHIERIKYNQQQYGA